jgi:Bacterial Ig-like domain (group 1)/Beta-propeller repeat
MTSRTTHVAAVTRRAAVVLAAVALAALLVTLGPTAFASKKGVKLGQTAGVTEQKARNTYAKLPLSFVPNAGSLDRRVRYSAQAGGASFYFTKRAAVFSFAKKHKGVALELGFVGANPKVRVSGRRLGKGRVNYLLGNDRSKWHTNLPTYGEVRYRGLWPGIDLAFRGERGTLKYEFHVAPGATAKHIRLAYRGAGGLALGRAGNMLIRTPLGPLVDSRPLAYQEIGGRRIAVESSYTVRGRSYGFVLGAHDRSRPVVIDPGLVYSTYLGGTSNDQGRGIAVDAAGNAYVTGFTFSHPSSFPTTVGAFDTSYNGRGDAFVTKLNPAGSALVYSTYLGGSGSDEGRAIAVDAAGNAYVTGFADAGFPTTPPLAFDTMYGGPGGDAFVTKLDPTGSALVYSTYLGGSLADRGDGIALDAAGNAYLTGFTYSDIPPDAFPTTAGAFQTSHGGGNTDSFVTKLNTTGSALLYSTFLGGSGDEEGSAVAVDATGNAYATGTTPSTDFPTTPGAFDTSPNGGFDSYVTKVNPNLAGPASLVYSTYLGGSATDQGLGVTVDTASDAYVTGSTSSNPFPTTTGAFDTMLDGGSDAFVTKLNPNLVGLASLVYSTYLGGSSVDQGYGVAVDGAGNAYVTGVTSSDLPNPFPTTPGAFDTSFNGGFGDGFVTKLNAAGSMPLLYSTYLGGSVYDQGFGIAVDAAGNAYVTGYTESNDFPTTPLAFDTDYNGGQDAFVTKLDMIAAPAMLVLTPATAMNPVGTSHTVTATVTNAAGQPVSGITVHFSVESPPSANSANGSCITGPNGQCTFSYTGTSVGTDTINAYADSDNDSVQDPEEPTGMATKVWTPPTGGCPPNGGDDDGDDDGLEDDDERRFGTLLGTLDSDGNGVRDGNDDADDDGEDDEDEDDDSDDDCPNDSDGDGEDDEDEDDDEDDD